MLQEAALWDRWVIVYIRKNIDFMHYIWHVAILVFADIHPYYWIRIIFFNLSFLLLLSIASLQTIVLLKYWKTKIALTESDPVHVK